MYRPALLNVGVIVWLASELMFFSGLFATYLTLRAATPVWPPFHDSVDAKTVFVATVVLVLSSGTMQLGVREVHRGNLGGFRVWLAFTWALGAIFEGMQIVDYMTRNFSLQQSAYSGAFYLLTGLHFLHVLGGLAAMIFMYMRSLNPRIRFGGQRSLPPVEMLSYYWHFVDVVWIALYAMIFLLPSTK
jgi:cytochrome c oxidase subunit III